MQHFCSVWISIAHHLWLNKQIFTAGLHYQSLRNMQPRSHTLNRPDVAVSCIIEREGITHFALPSAADALPPSVNKRRNQVTLRKQ